MWLKPEPEQVQVSNKIKLLNCTVMVCVANASTAADVPMEISNRVVLLSRNRQPVGLGRTVNSQSNTHLRPTPPGYIKVSIEYIKPGIKPPLASTLI